jgi:hypothetical protein
VADDPRELSARQLARRLRGWHLAAGRPSTRAISRDMTAAGTPVSHTTVADALNGTRVPSWPLLEALVAYLGGDIAETRSLWEQAVRTRVPVTPEPELLVIRTATAGLLNLNLAAQHRIIAYLAARFAGASAAVCELAGDLAGLEDAGALAGIRAVVAERLRLVREGGESGLHLDAALHRVHADGTELAETAAVLAAAIDRQKIEGVAG